MRQAMMLPDTGGQSCDSAGYEAWQGARVGSALGEAQVLVLAD